MPKYLITRHLVNVHEFEVTAPTLTDAYNQADELYDKNPGPFETVYDDHRSSREIQPCEELNKVVIRRERLTADASVRELEKARNAPKPAPLSKPGQPAPRPPQKPPQKPPQQPAQKPAQQPAKPAQQKPPQKPAQPKKPAAAAPAAPAKEA